MKSFQEFEVGEKVLLECEYVEHDKPLHILKYGNVIFMADNININREASSQGFWGRTCARLQQKVDKLEKANALLKEAYDLLKDNPECSECGTTEFLCGHNKRD